MLRILGGLYQQNIRTNTDKQDSPEQHGRPPDCVGAKVPRALNYKLIGRVTSAMARGGIITQRHAPNSLGPHRSLES